METYDQVRPIPVRRALPGEPVNASETADRAGLYDVARTAIAEYGIDPRSSITLLDMSENATYKVIDAATATPMILRIHRLGYHTRAEIESELDWLEALASRSVVRTAAVIRTVGGARTVLVDAEESEPRVCVAFEFLPGEPPSAARLVDSFGALGSITARMHRHVLEWERPQGFERFAWDLDAAFGATPRWGAWRDGLGVGAAEALLLERLQAALAQRMTAYGNDRQRYGLIHADLRLANLLVDGDHLAVIDFDDCGWGWYLYDLAAGLSFIEHEPIVPELIDSWLSGYRAQRPLSREDEQEIWTFILFRRLLLTAWIGSHQAVEFARGLGAGYTVGTCALAERFLSTHT